MQLHVLIFIKKFFFRNADYYHGPIRSTSHGVSLTLLVIVKLISTQVGYELKLASEN